MLAATVTGLAFLTLLWTGSQPRSAQLLGMAIEVCALVLFALTVAATKRVRFRIAFDDELPDHLVTSGPYKYVRHPFYTNLYLIFWAGFALITFSWLSLPFLVLMGSIYFLAARGLRSGDSKLSQRGVKSYFPFYRQQAGMFWPKLWRAEAIEEIRGKLEARAREVNRNELQVGFRRHFHLRQMSAQGQTRRSRRLRPTSGLAPVTTIAAVECDLHCDIFPH